MQEDNKNKRYVRRHVKQIKIIKVIITPPKFTEELVSQKGDNIDWAYKSHALGISKVPKELNKKIKSIIRIFLKFLKNSLNQETHLKNYLRTVIGYLVKENLKIKFGKNLEFYQIWIEKYQNTLSEKNGYEKSEVNEKLKHENKILQNMKYNC